MSSALNSVFGGSGIGSLVNTALSIGGMAFPPLGIATSVANLVTQGVGQAVNQAVNQLSQEAGLPKFLRSMIGDLVGNVVQDLCRPSHRGCDEASRQQFGGDVHSLVEDLTKMIFEGAKSIMDKAGDCREGHKGGGSRKAGSWLEAIAIAMGEAAGNKAAKLVELSNKLGELSKAGGDQEAQQAAAKEMNVVNAQFQATSQEFSMLQNAFSTAIKSIGEGMTTMARKG